MLIELQAKKSLVFTNQRQKADECSGTASFVLAMLPLCRNLRSGNLSDTEAQVVGDNDGLPARRGLERLKPTGHVACARTWPWVINPSENAPPVGHRGHCRSPYAQGKFPLLAFFDHRASPRKRKLCQHRPATLCREWRSKSWRRSRSRRSAFTVPTVVRAKRVLVSYCSTRCLTGVGQRGAGSRGPRENLPKP